MRGIIDRISKTPAGTIEIIDYKTGNYVPNQKAIDEDRQLALYQIGLADRYGADRPVELVWHYVARGVVRRSTRTPEQLEELRSRTIELIDRVRAEQDYEPRKTPLCGWCEFKSICPLWNSQPLSPHPPPRRVSPSTTPGPTREEPAERSGRKPEQLSLL
jgi:putative RecB family exonuclease